MSRLNKITLKKIWSNVMETLKTKVKFCIVGHAFKGTSPT